MRIVLDYEIQPSIIPRNYQRAFISLIKKLIENISPRLFIEYYKEQNKMKPFTFGVYFPKLEGNANEMLSVGNLVKLNISTLSAQLATDIYNGFINTFDHYWNSEGGSITFKPIKASLSKPVHIDSSELVFKTLSPFLITCKGESNEFLLPGEEGFLEGLKFATNECARVFLNKDSDIDIQFEPIKMNRHIIYHYKKMPTNKGVFRIKAEPEILQMIYDIGIGVHRSQGFGMLEVVR